MIETIEQLEVEADAAIKRVFESRRSWRGRTLNREVLGRRTEKRKDWYWARAHRVVMVKIRTVDIPNREGMGTHRGAPEWVAWEWFREVHHV